MLAQHVVNPEFETLLKICEVWPAFYDAIVLWLEVRNLTSATLPIPNSLISMSWSDYSTVMVFIFCWLWYDQSLLVIFR